MEYNHNNPHKRSGDIIPTERSFLIENILFDLDGVIIDQKEGITNSIKYALDKLGLKPLPEETLLKFIGPPLREGFSDYCGLNEEDAELAIEKYREFFKATGINQSVLYPNVINMLQTLKSNKKRVILATSKPEVFAKQMLFNHGILELFDFVAGATLSGERNKKGEILRYILKETGISASNSIMIGDRKHDIIGAKEVGMDSIGVLYGFGSLKELKNANADHIIDTVMGIPDLLIQNL